MINHSLVVIEAPGKCQSLGRLVASIGMRHAEVLATIGHLGANPARLTPTLIDENYHEVGYRLRLDREAVAETIRQSAITAEAIYLATDDDQEGDVIARDVARFCIPDEHLHKVKRVRLKALTVDEVRYAFKQAAPLASLDAARGDARRVVDRLIGALSSSEGAVGRVQGSLLLHMATYRPVLGTVTRYAPADDGGEPWMAIAPLYTTDAPSDIDLMMPVPLAVGQSMRSTMQSQAYNHDDILMAISLKTGEPLETISRTMQQLYERGDMTYPRASDRRVASDTIMRTMAISRTAGCAFRPNAVAAIRSLDGDYAHEAPNSLRLDVPVNREDEFLSLDERILVEITRQIIECGMPSLIQQPTADSLLKLPPEAQQLTWVRQVPMGYHTWDSRRAPMGIKQWTPEQVLLNVAMNERLGRPSTIVQHVQKFISRELVDNSYELTAKGQQWANQIDRLFSGQLISSQIEQYIEANKKPSNEMVSDIINLCQLTAIDTTNINPLVESEHNDEYSQDHEISGGEFY